MTTTTSKAIEFWTSAIREQAESGLTASEYCQLIEKSTYQFYYWKRRVRDDATKMYGTTEGETSGFVEIQSARIGSRIRDTLSEYVDIRVGSFSIRFTEHTDRALFKAAASALLEIAG